MAGAGGTDSSRPGARRSPTLLDDDDTTLFPKLTDEQLDLLARHGHVMRTEVGQVLFGSATPRTTSWCCWEGRVAVLVGSAEAEREVIAHRREVRWAALVSMTSYFHR